MEVLKPVSTLEKTVAESLDLPVSNQIIEDSKAPEHIGTRNLKPWKPGQSGNPGGRPKRKHVTDALGVEAEAALTEDDCIELKLPLKFVGFTRAQVAAKVTWNLAMQGDHLALDRIADRLEGRPMSALELRGSEEAPLRIHQHVSDANLAILEAIAEQAEEAANSAAGIIDSHDVRDVSEGETPSR